MFRRRYGCGSSGTYRGSRGSLGGGLNKIIARISAESFAAREIAGLPAECPNVRASEPTFASLRVTLNARARERATAPTEAARGLRTRGFPLLISREVGLTSANSGRKDPEISATQNAISPAAIYSTRAESSLERALPSHVAICADTLRRE